MDSSIKILFTDLDGTLLGSDRIVSERNLSCLKSLAHHNIIRVIATGRSPYSFFKTIGHGFPADFLLFSSGAGIIDLHTGKLIFAANLERCDIKTISTYLIEQHVDFMVHHMVPDNHHFTYFGNTEKNNDFARRLLIYSDYARKYISSDCLPQKSAQIIAVFANDLQRFNGVKKGLPEYQVIRTTSPLDGSSIWMEIYPPHVSKGQGAEWLCNHLGINPSKSIGIGNDFNDISLLDFTAYSYIVANAPQDLQHRYRLVPSNNDDGFCKAIDSHLVTDQSSPQAF